MADADGRDWRADLLTAVHNVFAKDRDATDSQLRTFKIVHREHAPTIENMQQQIQEQVRSVP